VNCNTTHYRA